MKIRFAIIVIIASLALSSCSAVSGIFATPTPTPDIAATALAAAELAVAQTLTAMPTNTMVPPTNTPEPTATLPPTNTPEPTPTSTSTMIPWFGFISPTGNLDKLPQGFLRIENETSADHIIVAITGTTLKRNQEVWYRWSVSSYDVQTIYWASYNVVVEIPGKTVLYSSFTQANKDKTTMTVTDSGIRIVGP